MNHSRQYTLVDRFCLKADQALRVVAGIPPANARRYPAADIIESNLSEAERKKVAALMRINHAGEVCAQALYQGQGLVSRDDKISEKMQAAAIEENDHLNWCHERLRELGSHTSYLNPFWYSASFMIGMVAGIIGDQWSLAFLAETEQQVVNHLETHLEKLPAKDEKSRAVLQQMQMDEAKHRDDAESLGAATLPSWVKKMMRFMSGIMVRLAYKW